MMVVICDNCTFLCDIFYFLLQLLELQSHINDSRFVFDVDFCDSCDDEERESTNTKEGSVLYKLL